MNDRASLLERSGLVVAGTCCALIAILSLAEVIFRMLRLKFYLASETSGFLMSWMIFFALPLVTRERQHINVGFLRKMLPAAVSGVVEVLGEVVMLVYCGVLIILCWMITADTWTNSIRAEGILRIPLFYPFCGIMIGFVLLWLSQAGLVLRLARGLVQGRGDVGTSGV